MQPSPCGRAAGDRSGEPRRSRHHPYLRGDARAGQGPAALPCRRVAYTVGAAHQDACPLRALRPRGAPRRRSARPRRPHPAARAHETRVTGPLDRGRAASAPGRRGGGPARLVPRARLPGCAGQRSRHPLSAGSPAHGSRRCGGSHGERRPGRRGVGAPAVDCARCQGIAIRIRRLFPGECPAEKEFGETSGRIVCASRHPTAAKLLHDAGMQAQQLPKRNVLQFTHGSLPAPGHPARMARTTTLCLPQTCYGTNAATGTARRARTSL